MNHRVRHGGPGKECSGRLGAIECWRYLEELFIISTFCGAQAYATVFMPALISNERCHKSDLLHQIHLLVEPEIGRRIGNMCLISFRFHIYIDVFSKSSECTNEFLITFVLILLSMITQPDLLEMMPLALCSPL